MRPFIASSIALILAALPSGRAPAQPAVDEAFKTFTAPMVFYVAKGAPDSCGPGCSEWIAADGAFDADTDKRLSELLKSLGGRKPPIFFHSIGGHMGVSRIVGRMLRQRQMAASVGETIPEQCRRRDAVCREITASNRELKARLRIDGAFCHSACLYALIGASVREVPAGAHVGIHSARPPPESIASSRKPGALTQEQLHAARKKYVSEMGSDPVWVDLAATIPSDQLRLLSREEIERFRIEKRASARSQ